METAPIGRFFVEMKKGEPNFLKRLSSNCALMLSMINHADFSVVVKNRAPPPKSWRWEIYRAGRTSPIERSEAFFETMGEANRAGKAALRLLLSEYSD